MLLLHVYVYTIVKIKLKRIGGAYNILLAAAKLARRGLKEGRGGRWNSSEVDVVSERRAHRRGSCTGDGDGDGDGHL